MLRLEIAGFTPLGGSVAFSVKSCQYYLDVGGKLYIVF